MPLNYRDRGASGTQIDIVAGDLVIGTLWKAAPSTPSTRAPQPAQWRWTFHITAGPPGFQHQGGAADVTIAKVMIEESWTVWLGAAGLVEN